MKNVNRKEVLTVSWFIFTLPYRFIFKPKDFAQGSGIATAFGEMFTMIALVIGVIANLFVFLFLIILGVLSVYVS